MSNKDYLFDLFKQYIRLNGDSDKLIEYAKTKGRSAIQAKKDLLKVANLLCAVELFIGKAVENI